jgi:twitching motility protein PilU
LDTPFVKELIKKGHFDEIKAAMEQSIHEGCQTFDQALFTLYKNGSIGLEEALANADSANNLRLKIKLAGLKLDQDVEPTLAPSLAEQTQKIEPAKTAAMFRLRTH